MKYTGALLKFNIHHHKCNIQITWRDEILVPTKRRITKIKPKPNNTQQSLQNIV